MPNTKTKKNRFESMMQPHIVAISLAICLLFGSAIDISAQQAPDFSGVPSSTTNAPAPSGAPSGSSQNGPVPTYGLGPAPTETDNQSCQHRMGRFIEQERVRYSAWMDQHFNSKSGTGSLLDPAISRYREFRDVLMAEYLKTKDILVPPGLLLQTEAIELGACRQMIEDALSEARRGLERKARSSSSVKKTTALISKYKDLNDQLSELNLTFVQIKAHLNTFADKIPCYITSCNQG